MDGTVNRPARRLLPGVALFVALLLAACGSNPAPASRLPASQQRLAEEVRQILGDDWSSPVYQAERARLESMGRELDPILVDLIEDERARADARADAIVLLADRNSPIAVPMLGRALGYDIEVLRSAAVLGLSRIADTSDDALELIRAATRDRSRNVRLNALQSLDIRAAETIRSLLERESDPEVREVALQLLTLAERRGAPLERDRRGALRTGGDENEPQIVFRPVTSDSVTGVASGDLRLELPESRDIPLASAALVVADVVPAFFSPDRSAVVYESDGQIHVAEIGSRRIRTVSAGLAPRLIPFSQDFVFLREQPQERPWTGEGYEVVYDVYRASFAVDRVERIGSLRAIQDPERYGGASPVRWMVVGESGDGFVLRGENLETFPLPSPIWGSAGEVTRGMGGR